MTVAELIAHLQTLPQEAEIVFEDNYNPHPDYYEEVELGAFSPPTEYTQGKATITSPTSPFWGNA